MNRETHAVREVTNYKRLVIVDAIRPAVSATWELSKSGFYPPTETGRQALPRDDYISEKWLLGP